MCLHSAVAAAVYMHCRAAGRDRRRYSCSELPIIDKLTKLPGKCDQDNFQKQGVQKGVFREEFQYQY